MQYDVSISTKGQLLLPKEIRDKFKLNSGSKLKVFVEKGKIVLQPRTVEDELQDIIAFSILKDGKEITKDTVKEYRAKIKQAIDRMVDDATDAYINKDYLTLAELKSENKDV